MSEYPIVKSDYNILDEHNEYNTHYLTTSADQVVGLGRMKSFSYTVGDVVYTDNNMQVALKCTTAGTTSADELDISTVSVGKSVEDGGVVWKVIARSNVLDEGGALPIELGGTGNTIGQATTTKKLVAKLLTNGTDLNTLMANSTSEYTLYFCNGDTEAKTMLNCPATRAFALEVIPWNEHGYPIQRITEYSEGHKTWVRSYSSWLQNWTEWNVVEIATECGEGYVRYESGTQICMGEANIVANTRTGDGAHKYSGQKQITFPLPFSKKPSVVANCDENAGWANAGARDIETTGFGLTLGNNDTNYPAVLCNYIAIGRWK